MLAHQGTCCLLPGAQLATRRRPQHQRPAPAATHSDAAHRLSQSSRWCRASTREPEPPTEQTSPSTSRRSSLAAAAVAALCLQSRSAHADTVRLEPTSSASRLTPSERQSLAVNRRIQSQNKAPREFPLFVREGYKVKVLADDYIMDKGGLIYKDYDVGTGPEPKDGQEVTFHYTAYNESGGRIDTSFKQGKPSVTRLGIKGLIPGFEDGIKTMRVGGRRRLLVPPDLGPPVGPSTFFSAKQCEVFDIELLGAKVCHQQQFGFTSRMVCDQDAV